MAWFSRREWLAASLATVLTGRGAQAEPSRVPLGFSLYGMKALTLSDAIATCAKIGYDGVELALMPGYPAEPKLLKPESRRELRQRLQDAKLQLHGLMENLSEPATDTVHKANLDRLKAAAELGHDLAPGQTPLIETILGGKPAEWGKVKQRMVDRLRTWAEVAKTAQAVVAIKLHVGNALHTPDDARWLIQQIDSPNMQLGFDFSHLILRGYTLAASVAALIPHAAFIHVKDARGTPEKYEFLLPGTHGIDYTEYAKLLKTANYAGPVVVEVSGMISNRPDYDPIVAAKTSYANLAPAFGRRVR